MIQVFILEPQEILRFGLTSVLSKDSEIEVVGFATNSSEAVTALERTKPDVLLLDECPDPNLIAAASDAGVASIVFSSSSENEDVFEALSAGAKAYILKGTSIALLLEAIRAVGVGATWLDPAIAKRAMKVIADAYGSSRNLKPVEGGYDNLSDRETQVLQLLCDGMANDGIAKTLIITRETVKTHVRHIMEKLGVHSRTEAAVQAIKLGLIDGRRSTREFAISG